MKTCIVLFSDDLRVHDNQAFYFACKGHGKIIPLFIYKEDYLGRNLGAASKVFLFNALKSFSSLLKEKYNLKLIIKKGNYTTCLKELYSQKKFDAIYFNHSYNESQIQLENEIRQSFENSAIGIEVKSFRGKILFEPKEIFTAQGDYFKVFTPFAKDCMRKFRLIGAFLEEPSLDNVLKNNNIETEEELGSLAVEDLCLMPKNEGNWALDLSSRWTFDYTKIHENFDIFMKSKFDNYKENRNMPSANGNSILSPYLRFGMISPRYCFNIAAGIEAVKENQFILELLWREFAYHVMFYNQNVDKEELKSQYKAYEWQGKDEWLSAWQKGETGYNIVDAGMKELYTTGFMHNRIRMIVASFLIKDLLINWRKGEEWFWNTLVDACPAVNPFSWQWVFGSGFDGAPYFRIFNPMLQQERFDPNLKYIKKWIRNINRPKIIDHDVQKKIAMNSYKKLFVDEK